MSFPKVYTVNGPSSTSSTSLPSWITIKPRSKKTASGARKRQRTQHTVGQLELIQEFNFPGSAIKVRTTEDGRHAVGTGTYKPMMKVWDLEELTVKFERVTDAENVDFVLLSSDWTKSLHLQRDRSLSLHTQMGLHHSVRLPTYGRCLAYHSPSAEALVGCTGTQLFRFSLEEGRFMSPLNVGEKWDHPDPIEGVNVVDVNKRHGLWSMGLDGGGGVVEFWDPRSRSALTRLVLPSSTLLPVGSQDGLGVTAMSSHPTDGLSLAVGTSTGHTLLYDLRSPTPLAVKDQGYGEGIKTVEWLKGGGAQEDAGRVVSADSKVIKVWHRDDPSTNQLSLHPPNSLAHLHPVPDSGLIFVACEAPQLSSYYVPEIGPAPKWAQFLDSVTEELQDDMTAGGTKGAYSDYKFVDRGELETLGLTHLIGTPTLKPYMHGYFLSLKLYSTARLIANPQSYTEHREKIIADRLAAKAESRIRARKDQPKVNKALAERLRRAEEREAKKKRGDAVEGEKATGVLEDDRFKEIFENPEYEVDEESREFALLNPATANNNARRKTAVEEEEDESDGSSSGIGESSDAASDGESGPDSDDLRQAKANAGGDVGDSDESSSEESDDGDLMQYDPRKYTTEQKRRMAQDRPQPERRHRPQMVVGGSNASDSRVAGSFGDRLASRARPGSSGRDRAKDENILAMRRGLDGGMEMSFIPSSKATADDDEKDEYTGGTRRRDRAGPGGKVERFGAGMEKGGGEQEEGFEGGRNGRTKRRFVGRSASKNAFRRR